MIDIKCKHCNSKVIMKVENEDCLKDPIVKYLLDTPCSECVPPPDYINFLSGEKDKTDD